MSAPPPVAFDVDTRFVELELHAPRPGWAEGAATAAWQRSGQQPGRRDVRRLAEVLGTLAEQARQLGSLGAFALVPEPWAGVTGTVRVTAVDLGQDLTVDDVLAGLTMPAADLTEPAAAATIDTAAGPASWLLQRAVTPTTAVVESLQFVWHFPERQAALVLGTAFTDLIEAGRWRPAVHDLARGITLLADAGRGS